MQSFLLVSFNLLALASASYDDSLARSKMLAMSGAAYSNPAPCVTNALSNGQLIRQYNVVCDPVKGDTCSGFTAISHGDQAIIISFRGTTGFLQLVTEGDESLFDSKVSFIGGGSVSEYFYNAWKAVWDGGMQNDLLSAKNSYPTYQLWVTGHSLGGSMASIAAAYVAYLGYFPSSQITYYTFGQPRTGDKSFAATHDSLLPQSYRVTHALDIVPHLPTENFESYYHHKNEVFYNNDMTPGSSYVECDADESKSCSDGNLLDLSINDHLHYFNKDVSGYGACGCTC